MGTSARGRDFPSDRDVCDDACPVRKAAEIVGGKWTTLIVRDLLSGTKRFSELQKSLSGVSPKMLSARLGFLESKGLVSKTIYPVMPPKTEYALTERGRGLQDVIAAMARFGERIP